MSEKRTKCTLAILIKDGKILLQKKAEGLFGAGRWNGAGGKIEENESSVSCIKRELKEELDITIKIHGLEFIGLLDFCWILDFNLIEKKRTPITVYVYKVLDYEGIPKSSEEGEVKWFDLDKIPYDKMWDDDKYWLPMAINGKHFFGDFVFNYKDKLIRHEIHEVTSK